MHSIWLNALKFFSLLFFIILINANHFALAEQTPEDMNEDDALQIQGPEEAEMAKRTWSQLQGSWGKRTPGEDELKMAIKNYQRLDYPDNARNLDYELPTIYDYNLVLDTGDLESSHLAEKRTWKSMNGAWGKRNLNRFRGTGKREPGNWNNLRGLWGKRSGDPRNWNKLSQAWGK